MWASSSMRAMASLGSTRQSRASRSRLRRPVSERSTAASWKTTLETARAASGWPATSKPASRAVPPVGLIVVVSIPTVVDLPAPFGPSSPKTSPGSTVKLMSRTACTSPGYVFARLSTSIANVARLFSLVTSISCSSVSEGFMRCRCVARHGCLGGGRQTDDGSRGPDVTWTPRTAVPSRPRAAMANRRWRSSRRSVWPLGRRVALWPLGFVALSAGDAAEAHRLLGPLTEQVASIGLGEPMVAPFVPDDVEALLTLGELEQAERLLEPFEQKGAALDRPWALATGARCRGLLLAAKGDAQAAVAAVERALDYHDQLQMPFELGRTVLVAGRIQRRLRQKRAARESLEQARATFDELGTPLWSAQASSELGRLGLRRPASAGIGLTQTERRVVALAASGRTNREIAAQLFISPKTVQANLGKVYEKLGIHSRAE